MNCCEKNLCGSNNQRDTEEDTAKKSEVKNKMTANEMKKVYWKAPVCLLSTKDFAVYMSAISAGNYEKACHGFKAKAEERFIKGVYLKEQDLFLIDIANFLPVVDIPFEQSCIVFSGKLKITAKEGRKKLHIEKAKGEDDFLIPIQKERARRAELRKSQVQRIRTYPRIIIVEHYDILKVEWFYIYENKNEDLLKGVRYKLSTKDGKLIDVESYYLVSKSAFILDVEAFREQRLVIYQDNLSVAFADVKLTTTSAGNTISLKHVNKLKTIYAKSKTSKVSQNSEGKENDNSSDTQKNEAERKSVRQKENVCLLTSDKMERVVDSIVRSPNSEKKDRQICLKDTKGNDVIVYGFAVKRHHVVMIDVADFVKKDISIDKSAVTFYTGTFTNSSRTDNLMEYFVLQGDPNRVLKIIEAERERVRLKNQPSMDKVDEKSDTKEEPISNRICIVSRADYISVQQYSIGNGRDTTHKETYVLANMRGEIVEVSGIYYSKARCGYINAADVLSKDINWHNKEYEFCSGSIGSFGVRNPLAKIEYYKNGQKTKELLQREQTKISLYERRYGTENKKGVWHSKVNLSYIPAGNVIQLYSLRCHCSKCFNRFDQDTIIDCTAHVNTKSGREVPVTVQYCSGCGSFFMNYDVFVGYQAKYGALRFECKLEQSEFKDYDDFGFADTSFLSRAGYSVRASVSQRRRQIILKELLDSGKYTKWEITEKISEFIKLRKNNPDMRDAIKRWEEDIAFVADYDTDNQTKVGRATFKQGGKITRR